MATEKSEELIEDMLGFSVAVIEYCQQSDLPVSVYNQLIRSATSIGANFSEAQDASSKKDFANKINIAKKEASETKYWLLLAKRLDAMHSEQLDGFLSKVQKYLMILQKITNTVREGNGRS